MEIIPSYHIGGYITIRNYHPSNERESVLASRIEQAFKPLSVWYAFKLEKGTNIKNNYHFQFYMHLKQKIKFDVLKLLLPSFYVAIKYYKEPTDVARAIAYVFKEETQEGPLHVMNQSNPLDDIHGESKYLEPGEEII